MDDDGREKKRKGRRPKDLSGRRPEDKPGFIPVASSEARKRDLDVNQADKHDLLPPSPERVSEEILVERKGAEEDARTGRGNGDGVEVTRRSRAAHSSP